jgi:hypothetical protein
MGEGRLRCNREENAPYSQQLGDFFTWDVSALVNALGPNYSARLGMAGFAGISPGKVSL